MTPARFKDNLARALPPRDGGSPLDAPANSDAALLHVLQPAETRPLRDVHKVAVNLFFADFFVLTLNFYISLIAAAVMSSLIWGHDVADFWKKDQIAHLLHYMGLAAAAMLVFFSKGHYRNRSPFWMEAGQIVQVTAVCLLMEGFLQFATFQYDISRLWVTGSWVSAGLLLLTGRVFMRAYLRKQGLWQVRTLLAGSGRTARHAREALAEEKSLGYEVTSQAHEVAEEIAAAGWSWRKLCNRHDADFVLIAMDGAQLEECSFAVAALARQDVPYAVCPPVLDIPVSNLATRYFFGYDALILVRRAALDQPFSRATKRLFDLVLASILTPVALPFCAVMAFLIRRDGGKALCLDRRVGQGGKPFRCIKFRSMVTNGDAVLKRHLKENPAAAAEWARGRKLKDDPRVTPIGRFLRKMSLDELPQLINVLRGEMSLIGPRPVSEAEIARYGDDAVYYKMARPGITGLWQVSGRSEISYERRVEMDRWYVSNWTLWHDIILLLKTIPALVSRKGAY